MFQPIGREISRAFQCALLHKFYLFGTLELSPAFMPAEVDNGNYRNCSFGSVCTDGPAFDFAGAGSE
jgi:hypothetical protein